MSSTKEELKLLEHLAYMNNITLQIKNYKNRIMRDVYKNYIKDNKNSITFEEFRSSIIRKEREQYAE